MSGSKLAGAAVCLAVWLSGWLAEAQFAPKIRVRYICPKEGKLWQQSGKGERHYCWEGKHYSKSTGGVPAFVLEYWEEKERESARFSEEMERTRQEMAVQRAASEAAADESRRKAGLPSLAEARRAHSARHQEAVDRAMARSGGTRQADSPVVTGVVERSQRPANEPIGLSMFEGIGAGTQRASVVEKLGQPHGSMSNLGAAGDEESLTYLVDGGEHASIRLRQGKVVSLLVPGPVRP